MKGMWEKLPDVVEKCIVKSQKWFSRVTNQTTGSEWPFWMRMHINLLSWWYTKSLFWDINTFVTSKSRSNFKLHATFFWFFVGYFGSKTEFLLVPYTIDVLKSHNELNEVKVASHGTCKMSKIWETLILIALKEFSLVILGLFLSEFVGKTFFHKRYIPLWIRKVSLKAFSITWPQSNYGKLKQGWLKHVGLILFMLQNSYWLLS